jgi:GNAT superfamily N-acetyltransferase
MEIIIKPLSPELTADFFDFFNNRAFTDNPPWKGCYCIGWQMTKEEEKAELWDQVEARGGGEENLMAVLREIVVRQIASSALRGYLAYVDGVSIGWCNANDKANFPAESSFGVQMPAPTEKREKIVLCFEIAPEYRGKGVASALLNRVVTDAAAESYAADEGFPKVHSERNEWDFTGPARLYEKLGFTAITKQDGSVIMRKELAGLA